MSPLSHLHRGAYIVVANQKQQLLDMMVDTLRAQDHCVFRAYDGMAALELSLALQKINLLVADTNRPGLTGPHLVHEVRKRLPTLPILYVKNLGSPVTPDELPPDVPVLNEPFTPDEFLAAIRPLLSGLDRRDSLREA